MAPPPARADDSRRVAPPPARADDTRSFEKLLKKDEKLAHSLGLPFVTASASTTMGTRTRSESTLKGSASGGLGASQSAPRLFGETGSLGVGVTQRRLRRELQRTISEKELEREKEARGSGAKAVQLPLECVPLHSAFTMGERR